MNFPANLRVVVQDRGKALPNVLVWINTRVWGQDYYRGLVGLTDASGTALLTRDELLAQFREDRALFPMDYKYPIEDCDDEIVVGIEGGVAFVEHKEVALTSGLVTARAKERWSRAANAQLESVMTIVRIPSRTSELRVVLSPASGESRPSA